MVYEPPPLFESTSLLSKLPSTLVTSENFESLFPSLVNTLKTSHLLALDIEFTGLPYPLSINNLKERYESCVRHAKEFALLSLGLSCFTSCDPTFVSHPLSPPSHASVFTTFNHATSNQDASSSFSTSSSSSSLPPSLPKKWTVKTFHFLLRKEGVFKVSSSSLHFLASSGFDFRSQILHGIPYSSGAILPSSSSSPSSFSSTTPISTTSTPSTSASTRYIKKKPIPPSSYLLRELFQQGIFHQPQRPTIVHNGFLDLVMLYQAFYHELPTSLDTFLADMSDLFSGGIFDTKWIAETNPQVFSNSTMLAPLFLHCEKKMISLHLHDSTHLSKEKNEKKNQGDNTPALFYIDFQSSSCSSSSSSVLNHCTCTCTCSVPSSPNSSSSTSLPMVPSVPTSNPSLSLETTTKTTLMVPSPPKLLAHASHTDAFMTGYIFLYQWSHHCVHPFHPQYRHRLYLPGKPFPLTLLKSSYIPYSSYHQTYFNRSFSPSSSSFSSLSSSISTSVHSSSSQLSSETKNDKERNGSSTTSIHPTFSFDPHSNSSLILKKIFSSTPVSFSSIPSHLKEDEKGDEEKENNTSKRHRENKEEEEAEEEKDHDHNDLAVQNQPPENSSYVSKSKRKRQKRKHSKQEKL